MNFSLLEDYFDCPYRFKLTVFYGFVEPLTELIGYGNALHAVIRNINLAAIDGVPITDKFIDKTFEDVFYLPYAIEIQQERMLKSARESVHKYVEHNKEMLKSIRLAESPIEIDLGDGITVNGRIDMVKEVIEDGQKKTVIVDFKTANKRVLDAINTEQLKYTLLVISI